MNPSGPDVWVVTGPGLVADARPLAEVAAREFEALGVSGKVTSAADLPALRAALEFSGALVVLPGPDPEARDLAAGSQAVRLDLTRSAVPLTAPGGATHLRGRGAAAEAVAEHVVRPTR